MKRVFIVLFSAALVFPVMAQARLGDFTMRGAASQDIQTDGFVAAHPSFPINSKVKVTNPNNGREIEAIIISRIDPSLTRIIDLSPSAALALGLKAGEQVILTVNATPRPVSRVQSNNEPIVDLADSAAHPAAIVDLAPRNESTTARSENTAVRNEGAAPRSEITTVIPAERASALNEQNPIEQNQLRNPAVNANSNDEKTAAKDIAAAAAGKQDTTEFLAWLMTMASLDAREARESREVRESREIREERGARSAVRAVSPASPVLPQVSAAPSLSAAPVPPPSAGYQPAPINQSTPVVPAFQPEPGLQFAPVAQPAPFFQAAPAAQPAPVVHPLPITSPAPSTPPLSIAPPAPVMQPAAIPPPAPELAAPPAVIAAPAPVAVSVTPPEPAAVPAPVVGNTPAPAAAPVTAVAAVPSEPIPVRNAPVTAAYPMPVQPDDIQIIPGLPDRSTGKIYRLQVVAYSALDAANRAAELMRTSGFAVELESTGSIFRVLAVGISAADVYSASVRLGSLGFHQIWVRE